MLTDSYWSLVLNKTRISIIADRPSQRMPFNISYSEITSTLIHDSPAHVDNLSICQGTTYTPVVTVTIWAVLVLIAFATAGGNFLVILAVILVKKLQTPSNILIVSLAFSDFLVGILVLPFATLDVVKGYWPFNEGLCDMYISIDVLLCTSSILNLCAISIDRYLVITRPLSYIGRRTPCRMAQMIAASWIISALISIPPNFGWKPPFVECSCDYSKDVGYQIYATFSAFYLPLIVMIVLYGKIFRLVRSMSRKEKLQMVPQISDDQGQPQADSSGPSDKNACNAAGGLQPVCENSETNPEEMRLYRLPEHLGSLRNPRAVSNKTKFTNGDRFHSRNSYQISRYSSVAFSERSTCINSPSSNSSSVDLSRRRSKMNSDTKVVRTLGVIMGCFCLCWLPFFIIQLLKALLKASGYEEEDVIPLSAFRFLQWLGYMNSFLNPLIYAKFNREFRLPFKLILLCHYHNINARLRSAAFSAQYGLPVGSSRRTSLKNRPLSARIDRRLQLDSHNLNKRNSELRD